MKLILIVIVIVLAGAGFYYMSTQTADQTTVPTNEEGTRNQNTSGTEGEDEETETGTDVGMEFPIPDADVSLDTNARTIAVAGVNHAFDVKEIRVKEGDTVTIEFTSTDGFHDWVIDEFNAKTAQVRPGTPTQVTFVADKKGTFEYYCSVGNHRAMGMVGKLIVE